ncbi:MAG TPA: AmmeMemoRadiSam system protein B [Acidobacteriota bacterium]|nr:AmmeMemoRadiSam system protein B [Acidobacteriota bacterium]
MANPKLRYLEAIPIREDGQQLVVLRDPLQISEQMLAVTPALYGLMMLFDGRRTPQQVRAEVERVTQQPFSSEDLQSILDQFDEALFLENERFAQRHRQLLEDFRSSSLRESSHAGQSYPAQAEDLSRLIADFYAAPQGAGAPGKAAAPPPLALIAPHIDPRLGGPCYTHAYRALAECERPDLFVILGTGHHGLPELFSVSRKDFQTPLGTAATDREFADRLLENAGDGLFQEDLTHRSEHTIEFQVVFLQHLLGSRPFKILPVLVSFSYLNFQHPSVADQHRRLFDRFLEALRRTADQSGRRICYIASVDLAHIGPRYGDDYRPREEHIEEVRRKDLEMLDPLLEGDAAEFFRYVAEEEDRRRICGFSPLYTLYTLLQGRSTRILDHSHAQMDETGSFVTFTSAVIDGE